MDSGVRNHSPSRALAWLALVFGLSVAGGLVLLIWATSAGVPAGG